MKKVIMLSVIFFLVFSGISYADTIRFNILFDDEKVALEPGEHFHSVRYMDPDAYSFVNPGEPDIPAYMVRVLIPADSEIMDIRVRSNKKVSLGKLIPYPYQGQHPLSLPAPEFVNPDEKIYTSGLVFPSERIIRHSVGRTRGFSICHFAYIPFEYDTDSQELFLYENAVFEVEYGHKREDSAVEYRPNKVLNELVLNSVINPADMAKFYPSKINPSRAKTDYDMLIVTTDTLKPAAVTYANYRQSTAGISYAIKTVSEIESAYTGATTQLKIKYCIFDYVQNNNISHVFLIGDGGTSSTYSVPDQNVYGNVGGYYIDNTIPGDIFYSCFDNQFDWNADGDSRVGEMNVDNADISPDVLIGRLSARTQQQILDYMGKVQTYIASSSEQSFVENLLLCGVQLWNYGDAESKSEKMYNEYIAPYWDNHVKHTLYDSQTTVSVATLTAMFNNNMNFMHMATHGDVTIWSMGTGGSFTSSHATALNNIPGTVVTISCITNAFDPEVSGASDPCLGEAFIRNPNGGSVVYIGCARYGFGDYGMNTHGVSFQYNDRVFKHMLQDTFNHKIGSAFTQSKIDLVGQANSDGTYRWVHFGLIYMGDPSLRAYKEPFNEVETVPVYRFFNTVRGGHLYTISEIERDYILENLPQWNLEGIKFAVCEEQKAGTMPAYRFFNTNTGIHLYTISETERDNIMELPQWNYEGIKFYVHPGQAADTLPVYRFFNTARGGHLYTISETERDAVMELPQWSYEGISFYVYPCVE